MSGKQMCRECRYAEFECFEYYGNKREWRLMDGCQKDLEPTYNEEEETYECEGYKNDSIRTE